MTKVTKLKTGSKFEDLARYSRAVCVGDFIFVSNTAGRNLETQEMPDTLAGQTEQMFLNIESALEVVGASLKDVISYRLFVPNPEDLGILAPILGQKFKDIDPTSTVTCPQLAAPYYKVEMEVTAYRGASALETETINIGK
ncbi:Rid family hydrolase [Hirschia litorea]|uniref:Rid family hydrolase n=1 Tax=Hirschia litorea TaxID=1199156 RepID=A0ABW2IK31_9PROT